MIHEAIVGGDLSGNPYRYARYQEPSIMTNTNRAVDDSDALALCDKFTAENRTHAKSRLTLRVLPHDREQLCFMRPQVTLRFQVHLTA